MVQVYPLKSLPKNSTMVLTKTLMVYGPYTERRLKVMMKLG